jgi:hypothetical protein
MLPVLGFFNKTEWRLFPEYSLEISNDKKNITLSIEVEGTQKKLTITNENLAKKSDAIIDDAIKNNFVITKTPLTGDQQFKKLIEPYNSKEWIPTILMIDTSMNIAFTEEPTSTPTLNLDADHLLGNVLTKLNDALITTSTSNTANNASLNATKVNSINNTDNLTVNVADKLNKSLSNVDKDDLPENVLTKLNDALITTSTSNTANNASLNATNNLTVNVMGEINKVLKTEDVDSLPENIKTLINNALNPSTTGGKRNPDRERVYNLPINSNKMRTNYYNYE